MTERSPDHVADRVDWWLNDGWLPSIELERTWLRGATVTVDDHGDRVEDRTGAEVAAMTAAEEQALVGRNYGAAT